MKSLGPVGKTLFGLLIFVSIILAWMQFGGRVMRNIPLPGGGAAGGSCVVWFVGSSTIYRWNTMAKDMAPWVVANRGVNGAMVDDLANRLEADPLTAIPGTIVFYIGENDIANGMTAEDAARRLEAMIVATHRRIPVRSVIIGLKPSPTRWAVRDEQLRFNEIAADLARKTPNSTFFDFGGRLLVKGKPGPYYDDGGIHLNRRGYRLWADGMRRALARAVPPAEFARCSAKSLGRRQ